MFFNLIESKVMELIIFFKIKYHFLEIVKACLFFLKNMNNNIRIIHLELGITCC